MNKKRKTALIVTGSILTILAILAMLAYLFRDAISDAIEPIFNKTEYVRKKDTYIIKDADERYLAPYLQEKGMMVVFFSSTCRYCLQEADELNNFIEHNPKKNVLVVFHDTRVDTEQYLMEKGYHWFTIADPDKTIREHIDPGSSGIPAAYLLGGSGSLLNKHSGGMTEKTFSLFYDGNNIDHIPKIDTQQEE